MINKREQKRNKQSELVCREVRFQLAKWGQIQNITKLNDLLISWTKVAKANKYIRP